MGAYIEIFCQKGLRKQRIYVYRMSGQGQPINM